MRQENTQAKGSFINPPRQIIASRVKQFEFDDTTNPFTYNKETSEESIELFNILSFGSTPNQTTSQMS